MGRHKSRRHKRQRQRDLIERLDTTDPLAHLWPTLRKNNHQGDHMPKGVYNRDLAKRRHDRMEELIDDGMEPREAQIKAEQEHPDPDHQPSGDEVAAAVESSQQPETPKGKVCPACGQNGIDGRKRTCPECGEVMPHWKGKTRRQGVQEKPESGPDEAAPTTEMPGGAQSPPDTSGPAAALPESDIPDHPDQLKEALVAYAGKVIRDGARYGFAVEIDDTILARSTIEFDATNRVVRIYPSRGEQ